MNSEINKKTPAFIYAKEFKLSKVLGNLQAYKLAVGDVKQAELDEATKRHGNNLGAVYGNLVTKASLTENNKRKEYKNEANEVSITRTRNKRKRRRHDISEETEPHYATSCVISPQISLDEPLPLPDCLLKDGNQQDSDSSHDDTSENSDAEIVDFLGLTSSSESYQPNSFMEDRERLGAGLGFVNYAGRLNNSTNNSSPSHHKQTLARMAPANTVSEQTISRLSGGESTKSLTTYKCWRCNRLGHLSEHCTVPQTKSGILANVSSGKTISNPTQARTQLQQLYLQCRKLKHAKNLNCNECGNTSNLAFCFECGLTLCDGRGHLIDHMLSFPGHTKIYSHKLQRLLKCSNSSCDVVNSRELLICSQCLDKTFDRHYSLVNATWSDRGLRAIANAVACQEHFHWHRMNCYNSSEETLFNGEKLKQLKQERNGLLSEFFF